MTQQFLGSAKRSPRLARNQGQRRQEQSKSVCVFNLVLGGEGEEGGDREAGREGGGRWTEGKEDRKKGERGEQN